MAGPDVKSETVDFMKLLEQVSNQLAQITSGQMAGQRRDATDVSAFAQDIGEDEMKKLAGGLSSMEALRGIDLADERNNKASLRQLTYQILQNAIETTNMVAKNTAESMDMVAKQGIRHHDLAIDRTWNVDEQGYQVAKILADQGVDSAVIAKILSDMATVYKTK